MKTHLIHESTSTHSMLRPSYATLSQTRGLAIILARIEEKKQIRLRRQQRVQKAKAYLSSAWSHLASVIITDRPRGYAEASSLRPVTA
jgi:hypothetical protein